MNTTQHSAGTDIPVEVTDRQEVATDVVRLELTPEGGNAFPSWAAGAHIDLVLPNGLIRQYSLCGEPGDSRWTIMVLREKEGRGGSSYVCNEVHVGQLLTVRGPRNHFALEPAPRYRFIAGGIGITPIIPMLSAAEAAGAQWSLTYCGRTRDGLAEAETLRARYGDRVRLHVDLEDGPPNLAELLRDPEPGELLYSCGPTGMLDAVEKAGAHWPHGTIHFERFTAVEQDTEGDTAFEVELATSDMVLTVPAHQPIMEVVREAGVDVPSSCEEGLCGTCETAVLSGKIDHRDSVLGDDEREANDVMMICVSRAAAGCPRLVLDL